MSASFMFSRPALSRIALVAISAAGLAACGSDGSSPTSSSTRRVNVSFMAAAPTSAAAASVAGGTAASVSTTADGHTIVVTRAQLVLARVELQRVGAACTSTAAAGDDDVAREVEHCAELELAPTLVDLPVNGGVASTLTVDVPAGRYASLEAKIAPLGAASGSGGSGRHHGSASTAFVAAHPDLAGVSVRVEGTFDGRPFVYVGAPFVKLETIFDPALDVAAGSGANLTIGVDLTSWFRGASGALVDPATALAGGPNAALVAGNVARSFAAFRDDDRDGRDDNGGRDHSTSGSDDAAGDDHGGDA